MKIHQALNKLTKFHQVRESAETHPSGGDVGGSKFTNKQQVNNSGSDHPINPSPVAEQLSLPVVGSQIVHKPQRF